MRPHRLRVQAFGAFAGTEEVTFDDLEGLQNRDKIGFEGQSPTGEGCSVTFDEIRFLPERLADLRDGS